VNRAETGGPTPTEAAVRLIGGCSPHGVIAPGRHDGRWPALLTETGADVLAGDASVGDPEHLERTLLLHRDDPGAVVRSRWEGHRLVWIGTLDRRVVRSLSAGWHEVASVEIPSEGGRAADAVTVWIRRRADARRAIKFGPIPRLWQSSLTGTGQASCVAFVDTRGKRIVVRPFWWARIEEPKRRRDQVDDGPRWRLAATVVDADGAPTGECMFALYSPSTQRGSFLLI
jgi:hypothetical protein